MSHDEIMAISFMIFGFSLLVLACYEPIDSLRIVLIVAGFFFMGIGTAREGRRR